MTKTKTTTQACSASARPTVSTCNVPTGQFKIMVQNINAYLTSTTGGASPSADHETLGIALLAANGVEFSAVSNGQTSIVTTAGSGSLTLYSDEDSSNGPIYFDSLNSIQGYGASAEAVEFCLQPDNTFTVENPSNGATDVMMCNGVLYLYTAAAGATSGCTPVTLEMVQ